jgi:hypothetical protein
MAQRQSFFSWIDQQPICPLIFHWFLLFSSLHLFLSLCFPSPVFPLKNECPLHPIAFNFKWNTEEGEPSHWFVSTSKENLDFLDFSMNIYVCEKYLQ